MKTLIIIPLVIAVVILLWRVLLLTFKAAYYEQTLRNHKDKFTSERWSHIEKVINLKNPFKNNI